MSVLQLPKQNPIATESDPRDTFVDYLDCMISEFSELRQGKKILKLTETHYGLLQKALTLLADDADFFSHRNLSTAARSLRGCISDRVAESGADRNFYLMRAFEDFLEEARRTSSKEADRLPAATSNDGPKKVLLVDDEVFVHRLMERTIGEDVKLQSAYNGATALEAIRSDRPDLIVLDVSMPEMSGTDVLKQIKETPSFANIPVIMLSNFDNDGNVVSTIVSGALDFLSKGVTGSDLRKRIMEILDSGRMRLQAPCADTRPA